MKKTILFSTLALTALVGLSAGVHADDADFGQFQKDLLTKVDAYGSALVDEMSPVDYPTIAEGIVDARDSWKPYRVCTATGWRAIFVSKARRDRNCAQYLSMVVDTIESSESQSGARIGERIEKGQQDLIDLINAQKSDVRAVMADTAYETLRNKSAELIKAQLDATAEQNHQTAQACGVGVLPQRESAPCEVDKTLNYYHNVLPTSAAQNKQEMQDTLDTVEGLISVIPN